MPKLLYRLRSAALRNAQNALVCTYIFCLPKSKHPHILHAAGRLGNQIFIYGYALALMQKTKRRVIIMLESGDDTLCAPYKLPRFLTYAPSKLFSKDLKSLYKNTYEMSMGDQAHFNPAALPSEPTFITAYPINDTYFSDYGHEMAELFQLKVPFTKLRGKKGLENRELLARIKAAPSVCLHLRLGDYVGASAYLQLGKTSYYKDALELLGKALRELQANGTKLKTLNFYVFSNDIAFAKSLLKGLPSRLLNPLNLENTINNGGGGNLYFVDINDEAHGFLDLELMRACNFHIIANSTFSRASAYLSPLRNLGIKKIILAPARYLSTSTALDEERYFSNLRVVKVEVSG